MKFENYFSEWLNKALSEDIPFNIKAFCFNLYEPAGYNDIKYRIELIGADTYDEDEDWACDDIWMPSQGELFIPIEFSTANWEDCLIKMKNLISVYLDSHNPGILKQLDAIAIGFVDGHLDLIWEAKK